MKESRQERVHTVIEFILNSIKCNTLVLTESRWVLPGRQGYLGGKEHEGQETFGSDYVYSLDHGDCYVSVYNSSKFIKSCYFNVCSLSVNYLSVKLCKKN